MSTHLLDAEGGLRTKVEVEGSLADRLVDQAHAALRLSAALGAEPVVVLVPVTAASRRAIRLEAQRWPSLGASRLRFDYARVIVVLDGIEPGGVLASIMGTADPEAQPVVQCLLEALTRLYGGFRA